MAQIKFYRGAQGSSLPSYQDGAIFVIARNDTEGDVYVDINNGKRLHITPNQTVVSHTTAEWSALGVNKSEAGKVYVYTDYDSVVRDGVTYPVPAIKVGDGNAYITDLPFHYVVTQEKANFWDHKVDAYMETDGDDLETENLVLTYGLG